MQNREADRKLVSLCSRDLVAQSHVSAIVPIPQIDVSVRAATLADVPFIDSLQKLHTAAWSASCRRKQIEGKIAAGQVLVAEDATRASPSGYCIGQRPVLQARRRRDHLPVERRAGAAAGLRRGDAAEGGVRAGGVRVPAVLLLVCAGHRGEPVLGGDGVRAAGVPRGAARRRRGCTSSGRSGFARGTRRRRGGFRPDDGRGDPRGPAGAADPAGEALVRTRCRCCCRRSRWSWVSRRGWRRGRRTSGQGAGRKPVAVSQREAGEPARRAVLRRRRRRPRRHRRRSRRREKKPKRKNDPRLVAAVAGAAGPLAGARQRGGAELTSAGKYDVSRTLTGPGGEECTGLLDGSVRCLPKAA